MASAFKFISLFGVVVVLCLLQMSSLSVSKAAASPAEREPASPSAGGEPRAAELTEPAEPTAQAQLSGRVPAERCVAYSTPLLPVDSTRDVFIDLGANDGQSLDAYLKKYQEQGKSVSNVRAYLWEMNPIFKDTLVARLKRSPELEGAVYSAAVTSKEGTIIAHIDQTTIKRKKRKQNDGAGTTRAELYNATGSSLFDRSKSSYKKVRGIKTAVCARDFSQWLQEKITIQGTQRVFMKIDIEGSEFELLDAIIASKAVARVHTIAIEWHGRKIRPELCTSAQGRCSKEVKLERALQGLGVEVINWDAYGGM